MADISLRDYLAKLDTLLKSGSAAEVILHCRHILQYYPKDAQAYRLLGQALVATSRWAEAGEVMRRVLSIYPDDREAHSGLSEVYRIEKRPDDAIWHLERAFEQTPNDQVILDNLRELYRKYHKTEHGKVQLTAAAVARQYIRNGLYEQAIDTLQKARIASPERLDLPLLLAQTYWDRGQRVEAAETALEVLKVLPDCLVANTLLAAMWLTESRPSDAQRYIGRIESLDPYLALELAQGQDVPDSAFKLEELDYQRAAEREMMAGTPDWLSDVDVTGTGEMQKVTDDTDAVPDFFNDISVDEDTLARQSFGGDLTSAEWGDSSTDLPYVADDTSPTVWKPTGQLSGLAGRFNKPATGGLPSEPAPQSNIPGPKRGLTGRFAPVPEQTPQPEPITPDLFASFMDDVVPPEPVDEAPTVYTGDLPDLASLVPDSAPPAEDLPFRRERVSQPDDNDPLAWLRSSGVEIDEAAPARAEDNDQYDTASDNLALHAADAADPLGWLQGYGGNDLVVDQNATAPQGRNVTDDLPLPDDQAGDPLAWLRSAEPAAPEPVPAAVTPSSTDDPLDWLSDDSLLDEAFDLESLVNNQTSLPEQSPAQAAVSSTAATPEWQDTMADEKDPLDWLSSEPEPDAEPSDAFTWMEEDDQAVAAPSPADFPDWLNASAANTEIVDGAEVVSENDIDWMTDLPDLDATIPVTPAAEEASKPVGSSMLNWLGKEPVDVPKVEQPDTSTPDWLGDLKTETPLAAASTVDENGFEWMSTADELPPVPTSDEVPDWLSSMDIGNQSDAELEAEPLAAADAPDWLTSMQPQDAQAEPETLGMTDTPDWLSSMDMGDEPEPLAAADAPDWLNSMQPQDAQAEPETLGMTDTPDWLSSMDIGDEPEPLAAADAPDWLSGIDMAEEAKPEPTVSAPTTSSNVPNWLNRSEPEDTAKALDQAATISDWASSLEPGEPEPEAEPEPLAAADAPDWLTALQPDDEPQAEPEPLGMADTPDWLSSMDVGNQPEAEPEPLAAADAPDWLTALQPDDELQAEPEPLGMADTPDWLSSMDVGNQPEAEPEPLAAADTPDWLTALQPDDEPQAEPEPLGMADTPGWLSSMDVGNQPEAEPEPLAAADTPDWLAAMQPEDEAQAEPEPLAVADTPDWLAAMQPEDQPQAEAEPEPLAIADTPDWLSTMQPEDEAQAEPEPLAVADTPDWLAAMQPEDDEVEPAAAIADDTPDWLSAMQQPDVAQPVISDIRGARVPTGSMSDVLSDMQTEPVTDADQSMTDEEWTEAAEMAPEMTADVPDWLSAMNDATEKAATNGESNDTYQWEDAPVEESMPAAPAPASNAPDWLNAMVPGLDVDYDAPEDEPVETEFLPTNKAASAAPAPAKEGKTRPEFGWLLDIVSEESQQVTVVADKTALRRFVFSKLPTWLRKPTEQPDKSPAGESEADNVDIPPWLQ